MRNHVVSRVFIASGLCMVCTGSSHAEASRDLKGERVQAESASHLDAFSEAPSLGTKAGSVSAFQAVPLAELMRARDAVLAFETAIDAETPSIQDSRPDGYPASRTKLPQLQTVPSGSRRPPAVAPLFEQPGVLTPPGRFVLEPIIQFNNSSSNRIAVMGYTIIPTLFPGRVDVREVRRNSITATLTARTGITNRLEMEVRVPYVYRSDSFVARGLSDGAAMDHVFQGSGKAIGDVELATRYQFNEGGSDKPYFVGSLRFKTRTGRDPFEIVTDCTIRCIGPNAGGTGLQLNLPTGSGFYALEPGLIWVMPSDPAIFFGTFSYMHNFKRGNLSRTLLDGTREPLGDIEPASSFQVNVGMGFALNEKASVSFGYDHNTIGRARQNGQTVPGAVRTQLGTIMVGFSYRVDSKRTINISIGGGLTRDTPDVSMMVRMPVTF